VKLSLRRVVIVGKETEVQQLAQKFAHEVFAVDDLAEACDFSERLDPEVILFDHRFTPSDIHEFINATDKKSIQVPVIVIGDGDSSTDHSIDFLQAGAYEFLRGKKDYSRLGEIINQIKKNRATDVRSERDISNFFADDFATSACIVGKSKAILNKLKMIKLVASSRCNPVLIAGETGTGKEVAARAVHALRCPNTEFVAVNCAALTANLLESELFGHVKGSFTGADKDKTGLLELAGSGTLFLDEISEMPVELQAKLLRVLQEKKFRKVGGTKTIACKATIIVSSNRNLQKEVEKNRFRRDLYYRLNICPTEIEPLRSPNRREDIPLLAEYFLRTSNIYPDKQNKIIGITNLAVEALEQHHWPGNVRELRNVIERAIILETTDKIGLSSILIDSAHCGQLSQSSDSQIERFSLARAERELIAKALQETSWQKTQAASLLGISRATLYAKLEQYNIQKGSYTPKETASRCAEESLPQPVAMTAY
jgi:DNA-binding NtrC family response regulator